MSLLAGSSVLRALLTALLLMATSMLAPNGGSERWGYDGAGRLVSTSWMNGSTTLFSQTATLDAAGERTRLQDSWGATSFGYDPAGRLTSASYPDGSTEADQYDPAGNRTVITGTTTLSGTVTTTNQYDAADELTSSAVSGQGTTTYRYDGDGNQLGSSGPTGLVTATSNLQDQLVHVTGPTTNVSYVADGQGDRLRSLELANPYGSLHNDAQELVGGLASLASDGAADYAYLVPGGGQAPLAGFNPGTGRATYLGTDPLGSVRVTIDPHDAVLGAAGYDAWGNARPYQGTSGPTLLAGLQGSTPFGFAGQYSDGGPALYSMRAREYSPQQGRFLSEDPRAPDMQVPVTINPYEYAGNMPTEVTDPSGRGWAISGTIQGIDYAGQSIIAGPALADQPIALGVGEIRRQQSSTADTQFWVQVLKYSLRHCGRQVSREQLVAADNNQDAYSANIVDRSTKMVWDIERATAYNGALGSEIQQRLVDNANTHGYWWETSDCSRHTGGDGCWATVLSAPDGELTKGSGYPGVFGLHTEDINIAQLGLAHPSSRVQYRPGRIMPVSFQIYQVAWEQEPGLILYQVLSRQALARLILQEHQADPGMGLAAFGVVAQGSELVLEDYNTPILQRGQGDYTSNILVVGESDTFEYSKNLAAKYPSYRIVATRYGSGAPPTGAPDNMLVVDNVDATNLASTLANTPAASLKFDAIVFNNPFPADSGKAAGGDRYSGVSRLVVGYWKSASDTVTPSGRIVANINPQLYDPTKNPKSFSESLRQILSKATDKGAFGNDPLYAEFTGMTSTGAQLRDVDPMTGLPRQGSGLQTFDLPVGQAPTLPEE